MNFFPVIPMFAAAINLALAFFVFSRDVRSRMNQTFLLWGLALALWNIGASVLYRVTDPAEALFWARITHAGVILCPVTVLHLTALLTRRRLGAWVYVAYAVTVALAVTNLTDAFIPSVRHTGYAWFAEAGPAFWIFVPAFTAMTWPALYMIWRAQKDTTGSQKRRLSSLLIADALLMMLGSHDLLPVVGFDNYPFTNIRIYPWGQLGACGYGLLVGYSVLHYQLLDIRVSLGRQAATIVRLLFLLSIAGILFALGATLVPGAITFRGYLVGMTVILLSALVAGQFFPRLIGGQTERLERRILGDHFEYQEQAGAFISRINEYTELKLLLDDTANHMREVLNLSSAHLIVLDPRTQETRHVAGFPALRDASATGIAANSPALDFFRTTDARHLDFRQNSGFVPSRAERLARQSLAGLEAEFVFPLRRQNLLLGLLAIGRKPHDTPITQLDYELCANLAHEISLALDRIRVAEQAALNEKLELLSIMSRGLAHDLNNLLTPIWTFIQVHEGQYTSGPEADLLRVATRNTQAIRSYVHEAIFFSTNLKLNHGPIQTHELLAEVADINSSRAVRRGCKIAIIDDARCTFTADKVLIQRMLTNLVSNALDASPQGAEVCLQATSLPGATAANSWLRFLIIDSGAGISRDNLTRVFEPYFTTKNTGDDTRGFGLGLTIVQRIVLLHGGSVDLRSTVGRGTTVQVDLPREPLAPVT